jgi:hypothetical protein
VTTYNDGLAASAASVVFLAGEERIASEVSQFMIHEAANIVFGTADDMTKEAALLIDINTQVAELYAKISGDDLETVLALMKEETWMPTKMAVEKKYATGTTAAARVDVAKVPQNMYRNTPAAYLKPEQALKMIKNRDRDSDENRIRKEKLFQLTGIVLRVK